MGVEWLGPVFLAAVAAVLALRVLQGRRDATRRARERAAYEDRETRVDLSGFFADVQRFFPFVSDAFQATLQTASNPRDAFLEALEATPSVTLGWTHHGLPALLPLQERQKHLYVVGKTGSGKTTLLLNLIREDLRAGRGVGVFAPEAELFRDHVLPLVPKTRAGDVISFAPGHPENPLAFNPLEVAPGEDPGRAAEELFSIFKRAVGEEVLGVRMTPILGNAFAALVGREGATLVDVKRLLEDDGFRGEIAATTADPYLADFWRETYPSYPKGSHLPVVNRLDQFLRPMPVRRALTATRSSFSIREALAREKILLVDLSGLAPESRQLLGQMLLAKFQLELMRREAVPEEERRPFFLYADEFQTFAGVAEATWRDLFSRGRRYGLALTLAHQYPGQLPRGLQDEIFGNVASIVAFALGASDAEAIRKELLDLPEDGSEARPAPIESLVSQKPGEAIARLGSGGYALPLEAKAPVEKGDPEWGVEVRRRSWERYGTRAAPKTSAPSEAAPATAPANNDPPPKPAPPRPKTRRVT